MDEKIDKLINAINKSDTVTNIKNDLNIIKQNMELINKITKYKEAYDINLKKEILEYSELRKYYQDENNLNYLIITINKRLKEITNESN